MVPLIDIGKIGTHTSKTTDAHYAIKKKKQQSTLLPAAVLLQKNAMKKHTMLLKQSMVINYSGLTAVIPVHPQNLRTFHLQLAAQD